ncbi:MAG: hypothetical protein ABI811_12865 [Acidobacteriota bacterium]
MAFVALQPSSAAFFGMILTAVLLFPLSTDPMQAIPEDRRSTWPIRDWEWAAVRIGSLLLSPVAWIGILLVLRVGWQAGAIALAGGAAAQGLAILAKRMPGFSGAWLRFVPAPPGAIGAIMRLQWRGMLRTLDPYVALVLSGATTAYMLWGGPLDAEAPHIMALVVALALSTHTQVLLGIDGRGAERYLQMPIRGWRILLAKDLAFLAMVALVVVPLDFAAGVIGAMAALALGHHQSVMKQVAQVPWRFTAGALFPVGVIQTIALFAVGNSVRSVGWPIVAGCVAAWMISLWAYGWVWDRRRVS